MSEKPKKRLWLSTALNTRKTIARILRELYEDQEPNIKKYRTLIFGLKALADCFREERRDQIEDIVFELKEEMEKQRNVRQNQH